MPCGVAERDRLQGVDDPPGPGPVLERLAVLVLAPQVDEKAQPDGVEMGELGGSDHAAGDAEDEPGPKPPAIGQAVATDVAHAQAVDRRLRQFIVLSGRFTQGVTVA